MAPAPSLAVPPDTRPSNELLISAEPDPDEFVPDAIEPTLDLDELRSRLKYPETARENGIEGMIVIAVLVNELGKPLRYQVEMSDNKLFEEPAIEAVMGAQFTPGSQSGRPAKLWVRVPVKFEL